MSSLSNVREDAHVLYGLVRGLCILEETGGSDARDGRTALLIALRELASRLAADLEALDAVAAPEPRASAPSVRVARLRGDDVPSIGDAVAELVDRIGTLPPR